MQAMFLRSGFDVKKLFSGISLHCYVREIITFHLTSKYSFKYSPFYKYSMELLQLFSGNNRNSRQLKGNAQKNKFSRNTGKVMPEFPVWIAG